MVTVVGIRFKDSGKTYYFTPGSIGELAQGEQVIVDTARGPELAKVAYPAHEVGDAALVGELKPVIRRADASDLDRLRRLNERQDQTLARCTEKIREHDLPMRLVKSEYSFDGSRLTFYFTSEKRVDFRMLVRDLARLFRTRIELRQIGPRDEAKLLGGIGPCGRILCCTSFLPDYARVSIKMAKDQDLPLNPAKISGVCGRLLCCLAYEHEQYIEIKQELPRRGSWVQTPEGPGEVIAVNVLRETVMVEMHGGGAHAEFAPDQLSEATAQVAELARARQAEGITPVPAPPRREPRHHGERRFLRDSIEAGDAEVSDDLLAALQDDPPPPPVVPQNESSGESERRTTPRPRRREEPGGRP